MVKSRVVESNGRIFGVSLMSDWTMRSHLYM